jgi:hypothetical protein
MRIAIVGTSNSLRKDGYTFYLGADPRVESLSNFSIGASTGLHSIRSTKNIDFSQFDYCLIDFSVNEEVVRKNNALNLEFSKTIFENLIVRCLAGGCIPVLTLLPRMTDTHQSKMRSFYLKISADWGIPYFDGYDLIDYMKSVSDISGFGFFLDVAHIRPWVSLVFARSLLDGLASLPEQRLVAREVAAPSFACIGVADRLAGTEGLEITERGSARASGRFVRSTEPATISLHEIDGEDVIGVCVNLSETNCILALSGENETALDLRNNYFENPLYRLVISALPLMNVVTLTDGYLQIRSLDADGAASLTMISGMSAELGHASRPAKGQIEIADLFVRERGEVHSPNAPVDGLNRPLLLPSSHSGIELAAGVYRSLFSKEHDEAEGTAGRARAREKRRQKMRAAARA